MRLNGVIVIKVIVFVCITAKGCVGLMYQYERGCEEAVNQRMGHSVPLCGPDLYLEFRHSYSSMLSLIASLALPSRS